MFFSCSPENTGECHPNAHCFCFTKMYNNTLDCSGRQPEKPRVRNQTHRSSVSYAGNNPNYPNCETRHIERSLQPAFVLQILPTKPATTYSSIDIQAVGSIFLSTCNSQLVSGGSRSAVRNNAKISNAAQTRFVPSRVRARVRFSIWVGCPPVP